MTGLSLRRATRPRLRLAGPVRLAARLAARDLRHRPGTGLLLLVALLGATTTMTLALVVRGSAEGPWDETFTATSGPHIVATTFDADGATDQAMAGLTTTPEVIAHSHGLVWTTRSDAERLAPAAAHRGKVLMLRLADPDAAPAIAGGFTGPEHLYLDDWQSTRTDALTDVLFALFGLIVGAVSLALLGAASVAVAVVGRMAAQNKRAALLKAVGATPRFVATFMLVEYVAFALIAGAGGLLAGTYLAPTVAQPVHGVLGSAPVAYPSAATIALVLGTAAVLVGLSTLVPTIRAARASTVRSLANPARPPRRSRFTVAISAHLPVPLLLGLRLVGRRPGRAVLSAAGLSVTVAAVVVALWMEAGIRGDTAQVAQALGEHAITYDKLRLVTYTFIAALVALALINAVLVAWTTALDNARNSALFRALGATAGQVTIGLTCASMLPAITAAVIGIPAGFAAFSAAAAAAGSAGDSPTPAAAALLALLPATMALVAFLTTIPSRIASWRPVIDALRTD